MQKYTDTENKFFDIRFFSLYYLLKGTFIMGLSLGLGSAPRRDLDFQSQFSIPIFNPVFFISEFSIPIPK